MIIVALQMAWIFFREVRLCGLHKAHSVYLTSVFKAFLFAHSRARLMRRGAKCQPAQIPALADELTIGSAVVRALQIRKLTDELVTYYGHSRHGAGLGSTAAMWRITDDAGTEQPNGSFLDQ